MRASLPSGEMGSAIGSSGPFAEAAAASAFKLSRAAAGIVHGMPRPQRRLVQQLVDIGQLHAWIAPEVVAEQLADEFHAFSASPAPELSSASAPSSSGCPAPARPGRCARASP